VLSVHPWQVEVRRFRADLQRRDLRFINRSNGRREGKRQDQRENYSQDHNTPSFIWRADSFAASGSQLLISGQTTFRSFERREAAAFLLDQVILHAADRLGGVENFEPGRLALAEQQTIAFPFARGPLLEVKRSDAAMIGLDPGDRIGAG